MLGVLVLPGLAVLLWFVAPSVLFAFAVLLGFYLLWHVLRRLGLRQTYYPATMPSDVAGLGGPKRKMRVCVIGAGAAGLVSVKELLAEGHEVVCYEKYHDLGGVFLYDEKKGGVYDSTLLTISNYTMAFSDFMEPDAKCRYWKHFEYHEYLKNYAANFQLLARAAFHFQTQVDSMERVAGSDKWKIVTSGGFKSEELFDGVAVCNGSHQFPRIPTYPGQETSSIKIYHSETYKRAEGDPRFAGKRVVCVGVGETGTDLAAEVAGVASKAFVSMRKAPFVIPREPWNLGIPGDAYSSRAMFYINHKYLDPLHGHDQKMKAATNTPRGRRILGGFMGLGDPVMGKIAEYYASSGGGPANQFATKNEAFVRKVVDGSLLEKPDIARIDGNRVIFTDGSAEEVDTILLSTGYVDRFPFLRGYTVDSVRSLYKHAFHPEIGPNVVFVGFVRPGTGGIPPCAELVARYYALLCSGERRLPRDWRERAATEETMEESQLYLSAGRVRSLVMYGDFVESMAAHIGCAPNLLRVLFTNPRLWLHMFYGPFTSAQFRLRGPGATPDLAEKVIVGGPIPSPVPFCIAQSVCAVLGWVLGSVAGIRPTAW